MNSDNSASTNAIATKTAQVARVFVFVMEKPPKNKNTAHNIGAVCLLLSLSPYAGIIRNRFKGFGIIHLSRITAPLISLCGSGDSISAKIDFINN